jgi:hypothetical protein
LNLHRFLAYTVLACWIGLTAVTVGTALQWSVASSMTEVQVQRALNAQKIASADGSNSASGNVDAAPEDSDAVQPLQSSKDRAVARAEAASEAMADELNFEMAERKQFWRELGIWGCLTLLASALLAERREGDERSPAHK